MQRLLQVFHSPAGNDASPLNAEILEDEEDCLAFFFEIPATHVNFHQRLTQLFDEAQLVPTELTDGTRQFFKDQLHDPQTAASVHTKIGEILQDYLGTLLQLNLNTPVELISFIAHFFLTEPHNQQLTISYDVPVERNPTLLFALEEIKK